MRKYISCLLILAMCITPFYPAETAGAAGKQGETDTGAPDRVIVQMKKPMDEKKMSDFKLLGNQESDRKPVITMDVPEGQNIDSFLQSLKEDEDVVYAEPDYTFKLEHTPNDPYYSQQWHHEKIESELAWERAKGSSDVVVAVIDDGAEVNHADLRGRIVSPYDTVYDTTSISSGPHGTHVAGIIGGSMDNWKGIAGVAPETSIMPIDVFDGEDAYSSDVIEGIYYAVDHGADIINMSLGGYNYSYYLEQAVQYAYSQGVVVIAAAGNDHISDKHYPSGFENVISVASTDEYDYRSDFSNFGHDTDIAAPGTSIYSTVPGQGYGFMSGTSMAAPVVAGAAALILANEPGLTNDQVAQRLYETADDLGAAGKDIYTGHGRVNLRKAVKATIDVEPPTVLKVYDSSDQLSGYVETGSGTLIEISKEDKVIATGKSYYNDFYVEIPRQPAGTILSVTATYEGITSEATTVTVLDGTPPDAPSVDEFSDKDTAITGTTEADANVYVVASDGTVIGAGQASVNGFFSVTIPKQEGGSMLQVYARDQAGNSGQSTFIIVTDLTPPAKPTVDPVGNKSSAVTGVSEVDTVVYAFDGPDFLGYAFPSESGDFSIEIEKQEAGTEITVFAMDDGGNESEKVTVIVEDTIGPAPPVIDPLSDLDTRLTGTAEPDVAIKAFTGDEEIATAETDQDGRFSLDISPLKAGTVVVVKAIDAAGLESSIVKVMVQDKKPELQEVIGKTRYSTAVEVSKQGWEKSNTVFLVNGGAIADGLTATPLASAKDAPILLTQKDQVPADTMAEIQRLGAGNVVLVGGTGVVSGKVESSLRNKGLAVSRLGGSTRYETSLLIAKELDKLVDVTEAYLAYGRGEPDALSIAAQSGIRKQPIILVDKKAVPSATYDWLKTEKLSNAYFIGGSAVIEQGIINEMNRITTDDVAGNRISGSNRHDTNAKVIHKFYTDASYPTIMVAKSETEKLVDALSAGPLAAKLGVPVLLVSERGLDYSQVSMLQEKQARQVHQIGGGINPMVIWEVIEYLD